MSTIEPIAQKVNKPVDLEKVFSIRREVFVVQQKVPANLESEHNDVANHFLATVDGHDAGTARWRKTNDGYKLERFAVLDVYRGLGVGQTLLKAVLNDIPKDGSLIYLNSQTQAMGLYKKFGFTESGPEFEEAGLKHYKMILSE